MVNRSFDARNASVDPVAVGSTVFSNKEDSGSGVACEASNVKRSSDTHESIDRHQISGGMAIPALIPASRMMV